MDLSTLSNDELLRLYQGAAPAPAAPDLSKMSDAELSRLYRASAPAKDVAVAPDVAKSAAQGLAEGAAGLADLPQSIAALANAAMQIPARFAARAIAAPLGLKTASDQGIAIPAPAEPPRAGAAALSGLKALGLSYEPETTAGKYARTAAEFVPGAGMTVPRILAFGALPGLASEAAGQAAEGSGAGTQLAARIGGGLLAGGLAGGVGALVSGRRKGGELLGDATRGIPETQIDAAVQRMQLAAQDQGVPLTFGEALNAETGGRATRLAQIERVVANSEGGAPLVDLYAHRPEAVERAGRRAFGQIASPNLSPSQIGLDAQTAARAGLAQTPEGRALAAAQAAAGPRVTPLQAGEIIQPQLRGVYDRLKQERAREGAVDYRAAENAPERVGIDRSVMVERPGEPIVTPQSGPPRFTEDAPMPLTPPTRGAAEPTGPAPESMARFIARNGGLALDGDAAATDLNRFMVPGIGRVARSGGKSIDNFWRQRLMEEGYLRPDPDGTISRDVTNEVLQMLQMEQRGMPVYPIGQERAARGRSLQGYERDQMDAAASQAGSRLDETLTNAGVSPDTVHPDIRDRVLGAMVRGQETDALSAYESVVRGMREPPAPTVTPTTVQEQISAPRFGQVNPQPVVDVIDGILQRAKGSDAAALDGVRRMLLERGVDPVSGVRELDLSIPGLHRVRQQLDDRIAQARTAQRGTFAGDLQKVRSALDETLKSAPEMARADANFAANSAPLQPFAAQEPMGRVVARDDLTGRMRMPAEQVPAALEGPSAAREFGGFATPDARQAYEGRLRTQFLDAATDVGTGDVSASGLRKAMRDNEDLLAQFPETRSHLASVAQARDGLARLDQTPLGKLVRQEPSGERAIKTLFPANPLPNSEREIGSAVSALARNNPTVARDLVRLHAESLFNEATQDLKGLPAQYGGAGFASALRGNPQQARNLEAAVRALPDGDALWSGFDRFLGTLEATGYRPQKGSDTAFNQAIQGQLKDNAGAIRQAISAAATNAVAGSVAAGPAGGLAGAMVALRKSATDAWTRYKVRGNVEELAKVFSDPKAMIALRDLARSAPGTPSELYFARRILALTNAGANSGE